MTVSATLHLDRDDGEPTVTVSGTFTARSGAIDDPSDIEDVLAHDSGGNVIDLTDAEMDTATEKLFEDALATMQDRRDTRWEGDR